MSERERKGASDRRDPIPIVLFSLSSPSLLSTGAKGVRITHKGGYGKAAGSGSQITDKKRDWSIRAVVHLDVDDDMIDHVIASARDVIAAT